MDEGRGQPDPEESIPILSPGRILMEAPEEEERRPAPGGGDEGRIGGAADGLPRQPLGWTPWNVGHVREDKREVLVAETVPGRASVRDNLRELSDALHSPASGRASPYIPSDHPLQMDGRSGDDADGRRT